MILNKTSYSWWSHYHCTVKRFQKTISSSFVYILHKPRGLLWSQFVSNWNRVIREFWKKSGDENNPNWKEGKYKQVPQAYEYLKLFWSWNHRSVHNTGQRPQLDDSFAYMIIYPSHWSKIQTRWCTYKPYESRIIFPLQVLFLGKSKAASGSLFTLMTQQTFHCQSAHHSFNIVPQSISILVWCHRSHSFNI